MKILYQTNLHIVVRNCEMFEIRNKITGKTVAKYSDLISAIMAVTKAIRNRRNFGLSKPIW